MDKVQFRDIVDIWADKNANQKIYGKIDAASEWTLVNYPDEKIKRYLKDREEIFSKLGELFEAIGVDYKKDNDYCAYEADRYEIIEVWFDLIGDLIFLSKKTNTFYETENYTVSIFFNEKGDYGKGIEFKEYKTIRIDISIVTEKQNLCA